MGLNKNLLEIRNKIKEVTKILDDTTKQCATLDLTIKEDRETLQKLHEEIIKLRLEVTNLLAESERLYESETQKVMQ